MFTTINTILSAVEYSFFNGIINGTGFQAAIGAALMLYISLYGVMIMFNLSSYRVSEVATRLIKVGIVYMMTAPSAWSSFNAWVSTPVVGSMNQIIREFTVAAEGGSSPTNIIITNGGSLIGGSGGLDPASFSTLFGSSMTTVFSAQMAAAIMSMAATGFFGWLIAIFLAWSLVEFLLMIIGAVVTYAKAIIGLAFLFGIAPIFFIFLMFDRSRPIFFGWVSQVLSFALQPVMLFAFLSFYVALVGNAVTNLFTDQLGRKTDFCWVKWLSIPGALWDMGMWRPTHEGSVISQEYRDPLTGQAYTEPINTANVLYFLMICHLGNTFGKFIETLATDIAGGVGPGIMRGADIINSAKNSVGSAAKSMRSKSS